MFKQKARRWLAPIVLSLLACCGSSAYAQLMGTTITTKFSSFPNSTDISSVVTSGVEIPDPPPAGKIWGPGRGTIDIAASSIRMTITSPGGATYGPGASFTFSNLAPKDAAGCVLKVAGVSYTTNKSVALSHVNAQSSFTATSVTMGFQNQNLYADWQLGEYIEAQLKFAPCATAAPCCPGYLAANNLLQMSKHDSSGGGAVIEEIDMSSPLFINLVTAMQAHLNLLKYSSTCSIGNNLNAKIRLTFTHWTTNSASPPPPFVGTTGWSTLGAFSIDVPGSGSASVLPGTSGTHVVSGMPKFSIPGSPDYYVILASAAIVSANGQPLPCQDFDGTCFNNLRYRDVYNPAVFKVAPPAGTTPTGARSVTAQSF